MAVKVLAGSVVAHGGAGVGVACGDLDVAEVDSGVEHGGDVGVAKHVRVHPRGGDAGGLGEVTQSSCGAVAGHAGAAAVSKDRADRRRLVDGAVDGPSDGGWEWDGGELVALAMDGEDAVAVGLAEVGDISARGFEDPPAKEAWRLERSHTVELSGGPRRAWPRTGDG